MSAPVPGRSNDPVLQECAQEMLDAVRSIHGRPSCQLSEMLPQDQDVYLRLAAAARRYFKQRTQRGEEI